jgi:hypothetical protein
MKSRYVVSGLQDDTYQVVKLTPDPYEPYGGEHEEVMYQGSLSDCEACLIVRHGLGCMRKGIYEASTAI